MSSLFPVPFLGFQIQNVLCENGDLCYLGSSGGLNVTVQGKHLDSVTEPVMVVTAVTPFTDAIYYQVNYMYMKLLF